MEGLVTPSRGCPKGGGRLISSPSGNYLKFPPFLKGGQGGFGIILKIHVNSLFLQRVSKTLFAKERFPDENYLKVGSLDSL
jgi:hypothetical protein